MTQQTLAKETFLEDVIAGLSGDPKSLPCKYFYDETGSRLFDQICELDEYYLTRTELQILADHATSIAAQIDRDVMLVEPGSGSSIKTQILLDSLISPVAYAPVDISEEHLHKTSAELQRRYPEIEILPVAADFTKPFRLPTPSRPYSHVALFFPGSTIGNFPPLEAAELLRQFSQMLGKDGGLLIGIDLQKPAAELEAAYDDVEGVTADFNLNLLVRINRELDADFDVDRFSHRATYNEVLNRIELSLVSQADQQVSIHDQTFEFASGESILTEYSHKYTIDGFAKLARQHGFVLHRHWTDRNSRFAVLHLVLETV